MHVEIRQGGTRSVLRDGMLLRLKREPFAIHFHARRAPLAVSARETDIASEPLVGRVRTDTRAFVNGGEAASYGDRAQDWLILSPWAFSSVYYHGAKDRRADYLSDVGSGVMELRFQVRRLLIDGKTVHERPRSVSPDRYPPLIHCVFFMDKNGNKIIDADELIRVRLTFSANDS